MSIKIAVLFSKFENFHWEKDPGYISNNLSNLGYDVSVFSTLNFSSVHDKIQTTVLSKEKYFSGEFLKKSDFTHLFIYHFDFRYFDLLKIAQKLSMKVILKADHNGYLPMIESDTIRKNLCYKIKNIVKSFLNMGYRKKMSTFLSLVDTVIIESYIGYRRFTSMFPEEASKFKVVPNGYYFPDYKEYNKENNIIAIGRWDDFKQKRVERLLNSFLQASKKMTVSYKLILIGACPSDISAKYKSSNIEFMGQQPKSIIEEELKKSKILLMSSEWEGFPNVIVEALAFNNTLVSTPFAAAIDSVNGGNCGIVSEDYTSKDLANALFSETILWNSLDRNEKEIYTLSYNYFDWKNIMKKITLIIEGK